MARAASDIASAFVAARPASEWSASNATDHFQICRPETNQNAPAAVSESSRGIPRVRRRVGNRTREHARNWRGPLSCRSFHSESAPNLLMYLGAKIASFSECALISLKVLPDFDSAIRRFDPSRPSQSVLR
jgi:hypothetical protein